MFPNTFPQLSGPQMSSFPQTQPGAMLPAASITQLLNSDPYGQFQRAMQDMQRSQQDLRAPNVGAQFQNTQYAPPQAQSGAPNPQGGGY